MRCTLALCPCWHVDHGDANKLHIKERLMLLYVEGGNSISEIEPVCFRFAGLILLG